MTEQDAIELPDKHPLRLRAEKAERERDETRAQFDRHVEWAAQQCEELLSAVNGLLGLVQLIDGRDDMPTKLANNHRYLDALALVDRIASGQ